jgi:DNA-binding CsgD family transcriptional regulator
MQASSAVYLDDPSQLRSGPARLVEAADLFHGHDQQREEDALLQAFHALQAAEHLTDGIDVTELGHRFEATAATATDPARSVLLGLGSLMTTVYHQAVPAIRAAMETIASCKDTEMLRFGFVGIALSTALWDERIRDACLDRSERLAREAGSLLLLDAYLWTRSVTDLDRGDPRSAGRSIERVRELRKAMGYEAEHVVNGSFMAWTGAAPADIERIMAVTLAQGWGGAHTVAATGLAIREIAEGRYHDAFERLAPFVAQGFLHVGLRQLPEYVEAAARSGHPDEAERVTEQLRSIATANGSTWARGITQRCTALIDAGDAETHYTDAIATLSAADVPGDLFRAHLVYGEWLRRHRRRKDARAPLIRAHEGFTEINAVAFRDRAARELEALGVTHGGESQRRGTATDDLTPREAAVAQMAAQGSTNAEIGAALFISANTVDYHLRKVFQKLGLSSRRQLGDRLPPVP